MFTILGVLFCVTLNTFNLIDIKIYNIVAYFRKYYIQICHPFFICCIFWFRSRRTKSFSLRRPHFRFDGCWIKNILYTNQLMYYGLEFGRNMERPLFIFNFMFVIGYYNEFTFLRRQIFLSFFFKDNIVHHYIYHTINRRSMIMTLNVFSNINFN